MHNHNNTIERLLLLWNDLNSRIWKTSNSGKDKYWYKWMLMIDNIVHIDWTGKYSTFAGTTTSLIASTFACDVLSFEKRLEWYHIDEWMFVLSFVIFHCRLWYGLVTSNISFINRDDSSMMAISCRRWVRSSRSFRLVSTRFFRVSPSSSKRSK